MNKVTRQANITNQLSDEKQQECRESVKYVKQNLTKSQRSLCALRYIQVHYNYL